VQATLELPQQSEADLQAWPLEAHDPTAHVPALQTTVWP